MSKIDVSQVAAIADTIMHNFIPKDPLADQFSFHFTLPPAQHYLVKYQKDNKGNWTFQDYEAIASQP
ncbi:MAG: hypothetical protein EOO99_05075 [Pedobacter sp.]|nr:MAG: hypothetical protein EOO99_05075 [Pedobacter sp.]